MSKLAQVAQHAIPKLLHHLPFSRQYWAKLDLLKTLVQRDLEARYKGSILGNGWSLLNQLAQLLVYTYVFAIVLKVKLPLDGLPANNFTYGLWLFAGLLPWMAFTAGFSQAANVVVAQTALVKRVVFPLALLPLIPIMAAFVESSLGLMTLITLTAITSKAIHPTLWLFPLVWIPQLLFTMGLGYLAASLTVFFRDIPQTIGVLINLWFYVTPIVYPTSVIPEQWQLLVFWLNPMTAIVEMYRDLVLMGKVTHWMEWGVTCGSSLVVFLVGLSVYQKLRSAFADVL